MDPSDAVKQLNAAFLSERAAREGYDAYGDFVE